MKITQNVVFELSQFWQFSPIFVLLKLTCLVSLFVFKLKVFKAIFGIFNEFLSTQNVAFVSGNTVWQQTYFFKNSPKLTIFGILNEFKHSSLRSQCCKMRLFLRFSKHLVGFTKNRRVTHLFEPLCNVVPFTKFYEGVKIRLLIYCAR